MYYIYKILKDDCIATIIQSKKKSLHFALYSTRQLCLRNKDKLLALKSHSKTYIQTWCVLRQENLNV